MLPPPPVILIGQQCCCNFVTEKCINFVKLVCLVSEWASAKHFLSYGHFPSFFFFFFFFGGGGDTLELSTDKRWIMKIVYRH